MVDPNHESTRPDTLPSISRVGWAGAVMLKIQLEKKKLVTDGPMDRRMDQWSDGPTDKPLIESTGRD